MPKPDKCTYSLVYKQIVQSRSSKDAVYKYLECTQGHCYGGHGDEITWQPLLPGVHSGPRQQLPRGWGCVIPTPRRSAGTRGHRWPGCSPQTGVQLLYIIFCTQNRYIVLACWVHKKSCKQVYLISLIILVCHWSMLIVSLIYMRIRRFLRQTARGQIGHQLGRVRKNQNISNKLKTQYLIITQYLLFTRTIHTYINILINPSMHPGA